MHDYHLNILQVVLANGDLAIDMSGASPTGEGDYFECVASFEQRNVTVASYRIVNPMGDLGRLFSAHILHNVHTCS